MCGEPVRDIVTTILELAGFLMLLLALCVWLAVVAGLVPAVVVGLAGAGAGLVFVGWLEGRR